MRELLTKPLLVVTGKGGVGKSTVAAALGMAAAARGRRTIVAEVAARDDVSRALSDAPDAPSRSFVERDLGAGLHHISIDPESALEEYVKDQLPRGVADLLAASRMFSYLVAATPGLRELLTVGKVWELAQPDRRTPGAHPYDLVILDAPATGHGVAVLTAPGAFAGAARMGPIARQGGIIHGMLADPERTGIVAGGPPAAMPVKENLARRAADALPARRRGGAGERGGAGVAGGPRGAGRGGAGARPPRPGGAAAAGRRGRRGPDAAVRLRPRRPGRRGAGPPRRGAGPMSDLVQRLEGMRVVVCAGSGGVGKTTTSAAIAMGLAARGARVCVVTIDPARRLADALGIEQLGSEPRRVDDARFAGHGITIEGELWAMMLDPKRTFDELIARLAPDDKTRDEILANRIYRELSGAVAGSQEFTAVAKLYDLDRSGQFDVIVLDTPPSRNALDFLDAPDRLTGFLEGRALRLFLAPSGLAAKVVGRGTSVVLGVLRRVTGVDLMNDLSVFFAALSTVLDGFRERAAGVKALLADGATAFLIVTSPEREPVEEAIFFRGKLREAAMPFGGLVVNRVHPLAENEDEVDEAAIAAELAGDAALARKVARTLREFRVLAHRDARAVERLRREVGDDDPIVVPHLDGDVHDVDGLVLVHRHLFAEGAQRSALLIEAAF
jgi:anion-transporting  ArsA/GET3 family ATPase